MQVTALILVVGFAAFHLFDATEEATEAPVSALGEMLPNTPPDLTGTVVTEHTVMVAGVARTFRSIVPEHPARHLPLLLVLHGRGEGPWTAVRTTGFLPLARTGAAALVYPDGIGRSWNAGAGCCGAAAARGVPDAEFVDAVVAAAEASLPVDPARVYLVGYSNGGKLAYALACGGQHRYAGVATYGAVPLTACPRTTASTAVLPYLLAAGTRDAILPLSGAPKARPPTPSVRAAAAQLAARDGCTGGPEPVSSNRGSATLTRWTGCPKGASVELVVLPADHSWPSGMAAMAWNYLSGSAFPA